MNRLFFIALLLTASGSISAQQIPLYNLYYYNPMMYNPAMAGTGNKANSFLSHRIQWENIASAPQTTLFSIDAPLKNKKMGFGASLLNHSSGFIHQTGVNAFYSHRVDISENSNLNFGFSIGVFDNQIDFSQAIVKDADDPFLLTGLQRKTALDAKAGLIYILKKTEIGFSSPQLLDNSLKYANNSNSSAYHRSKNYLFSVKQTFYLDKENNISVFPLLIMRLEKNVPFQYDVNAVINWKDAAWFGAFYQSDFSAGANVRIKILDALSAGYCYSIPVNSFGATSGSSHEILIGYTFNIPNKKENDNINQKQQEDILSLSSKLQAIEEAIKKNNESETQNLKDQINALNLQLEHLKKENADSSSALKLQIALLEEKVNLLVKLIGN